MPKRGAPPKKVYEESGSEAEEEEMEEMEEEEMEEGGEQDDDDDGEDDEDEGEMDEDEYPEEERELERNALLSKAAARNPAINNRPVLLEKLQDIVLGGGHKVPWVEVLTVSAPVTAESLVENVDDDLTRELAFYDMAIAGVKECHEKCRALGIAYERPPDYYAEMVKTDDHMLRVKKELLQQAAKVEAQEIRRKQRDAKKFGKALQTERRQDKEKRKRDDLQSIEKWRKNRTTAGDEKKNEALLDFATSKEKRKGLSDFIEEKTGRRPDGPRKSDYRQAMDKKYGFGGRGKTLSKRNTFESAHDMSDFSVQRNKRLPPGVQASPGFKGGKGGGKGGGKQRPGKSSRDKQRSRRK